MNEAGRINHVFVEITPSNGDFKGKDVCQLHPREMITESLRINEREGNLQVKINDVRIVEDNVFYEMVMFSASTNVRWTMFKRFQEFSELNLVIESRVQNAYSLPPFPEKYSKWFTDHLEESFILERKSLLVNYMDKLNQMTKVRALGEALQTFLLPHPDDEVKLIEYQGEHGTSLMPPAHLIDHARITESELDRKSALVGYETIKSKFPAYDSPEVTSVYIPAAQILKRDHVVYQIQVENMHKRETYQRWTVLRRFVEFVKLDDAIREYLFSKYPFLDQETLPMLPPRSLKAMVDHLQVRFIEKRRLLLQLYLQRMIHIKQVAECSLFLEFLQVT